MDKDPTQQDMDIRLVSLKKLRYFLGAWLHEEVVEGAIKGLTRSLPEERDGGYSDKNQLLGYGGWNLYRQQCLSAFDKESESNDKNRN